MSSVVTAFVHATRKSSQKVPHAKVVRSGSPGWIPMTQAPFSSSCIAVQYDTERCFSTERFQSYTASKIRKFQYNHVIFFCFLEVHSSDDLSKNEPRRGVLIMKLQVSRGLPGRRRHHPDGLYWTECW